MKEIGLFLIKPDAILQGEKEVAAKRIEDEGLEILIEQLIFFTPELISELYCDRQDNLSQFWEGYLIPEPSIAMIVEGEVANEKLTRIKKRLRQEFDHDGFYTGTHCSDNATEARRQIKLLFRSDK